MLKPINDKLLLLPKPKEQKTPGGLFIPETIDDGQPAFFEVVDKGENVTFPINIGDTVIINFGMNRDIQLVKMDKKAYHLVSQETILAIVK